MSLETGTYIFDLQAANPPGTDLKSQGDDHIRLIKSVLKNTFPNANKAFNLPGSIAFASDTTLLASHIGLRVLMQPVSGPLTVTLPTLNAVADDGWEVIMIKYVPQVHPIFIQVSSGTLNSGQLTALTKTRRAVPFAPFRIMWLGGSWVVERCIKEPVGTIVPIGVQALPTGYVGADGQTLVAADYPDYTAANAGSSVVIDARERVLIGFNDTAFQDRLNPTRQSVGGINPLIWGSAGGLDGEQLPQSRLVNAGLSVSGSCSVTTSGSVADGSVSVSGTLSGNTGTAPGGSVPGFGTGGVGTSTPISASGSIANGSVSSSGSGSISGSTGSINGGVAQTFTTNVQPAIVARYAVVVE